VTDAGIIKAFGRPIFILAYEIMHHLMRVNFTGSIIAMDDVLVYMDCCCLNRPYDDQTQDKIRIESDAIMAILFHCFYGTWRLVGSDVLHYEIMKMPDMNKKARVLDLYKIKKETILLSNSTN
jgi:hypothetical protein